MDRKKTTMPKTAEELHQTKNEPSGLETGLDIAVTVIKKRRKAESKQRPLPDLAEAETSDTAAKTTDAEYSAVTATASSAHVKRHPTKLDRNSGVVRIIEKSKHKRAQKTENIEEALQLDVGAGSCQW